MRMYTGNQLFNWSIHCPSFYPMSSAWRKLRWHSAFDESWIILSFYHFLQYWCCIPANDSLLSKSPFLPCLYVSLKEAKRTFLTPGRSLDDSRQILSSSTTLNTLYNGNQLSCMSRNSPSLPCLYRASIWSRAIWAKLCIFIPSES